MNNNQEMYNILSKHQLVWVSGEYKNKRTKFTCLNKDGYKIFTSIMNIRYMNIPSMVDKSNPYTLENISLYLMKNNRNITLKEGQIYRGSKSKLIFICGKCNSEFDMAWSNIHSGQGCPYCNCSPNKVNNTNSIRAKAPWMIRYLKYNEDADKYTPNSMCRIKLLCPDCKTEKSSRINDLYTHKFSCPACSDKISIPEKFVYNVLMSIGERFIKEYEPKWSNGKRYDFYLPEFSMIIEAHGMQHYANGFDRTFNKARTLVEEQENDLLKERLAKENGIEHYVIIDCRESKYDFLKISVEQSLSDKLNLFDINWDFIFDRCSTSLVKMVANLYDSDMTTYQISEKLNLSINTIIKYLHRANAAGLTYYNGRNIRVRQFTKQNEFVSEYESIKIASDATGICKTSICQVCLGKLKTAGKFKWEYV